MTANNALIFGNNAGVSAANGIAIGEKSASTSEGSIAFGLNSKAGNGSGATFGLAKDAIAIGTNSSARGDKAVAIGKGTQANHDSNIAIGNSAETGRDLTVSNYDIKNISIGYEAGKGMNGQFNSYLGTNAGQDSKGDGNSAFGLRAGKTVTGNTNTAIGMDSGQNVKASSNTAIGLNAGQNVIANGGGSNVAIGTNAGQNVTTTSSGGGDNIAIGTNAGRNITSSIGHNTAVGHSAGQNVTGTNNVSFGSGSGQNVNGDNNTSMGINAGIGVKSSSNVSIGSDSGQNTDGVGNTAIGYQAGQKVTGGHNISMGYQSAKGLNGGSNTIIGFQAGQEIVGGNNIIVGTNATKKVTVDNVVSIGTNSTASTNNSVAVGSYSKATGNAAIAIGQGSNASKDNSMAIGNRSTVNAVKDVAIGSDSSTSATTGVSKATITVPGTGKSITYGTFAGSNPDAAFSVGSAGKERQIQNVAAGRVTATSTDAINGSQLFAVANELGKTWKANAGGNLSGSATSTQVMPGDEVQFVAGKNLEVEQNLATGSQKYTYSLKKDVDLGSTGSLKAGPVTINNNGIDAGNKKITNVAPGTADTDAANVSQVKAAKTTVSSDDNSITVTETTKPDGHKNYDLSVDVTKLDAANKSLSNINNDGNKVISDIARKSVDVVAGTNIKNIVKNDVQNSDGTTTTTYTINANGAKVVAGDGVTVATGTPGSNNITDYTVSVKNTTLTAAPGSTTVTAGDNNSYAKAGDVATAITNAAKAAKTEVKSPDSSINVTTDNTSPDGHTIYNVTIDKSGKVAAGDTKLVTGDTVNTAITNAKTDLINNNPLKFGGDSGTAVTRKLGDQLDIKGGATGATTSGNIAVIADGNNTLNIQLAKNLTGLDSISTNGGNTVINDNGITTPKVTINNAPTTGTDATNKDYVDSTKTKVTSNDSSVVINKTTSGNQDVYDLSVDVTKLDAANKSLSNINNDGNKVISNIARKSVDVVAGTNIKDIVKNDVQNSDGTTTTTYTINANGAKVVAGDGVTVATGTPGSNNITDYTVSVKNTTLTAAPGSTTVTAGDNNSYAKAGDVATAITNVGKASKTTVTSNDSSVTVVSKVDSGDGHINYDLSVDTSKVAANTNLTYKANSGTGLTTTLANGLDFKDGDNTVATVGPNGEVKYSLNPTVAGINSITTNGGNTVINDNGITTPKVTINNAPTAGTDATNKDYVDSTKTKVTSNDSSVVVNKTTSGNQDIYDLSVDVTKLDAANKSLSNINNDGNKVISNIARKSVDVVAGTNIKDIVKNDVQNSDGTTTTTYTINANGAKVVAGDGVTVATGTPGSNNITDYTVSVKNTTLTAAPGSTTVTAGDNNSYAKAGDVATAITNVGKASKTTVTSNDSSVTVVSKVDSGDGHINYDLSVDTSKVAANTNLTYKANSGTGLTTTLANGLDFKDGDNTVATVGPNGEVKYSLNPTVAGINSITTNGGNTVINDNGITTPKVTINNAPTAGTDATNKDYVDSTKTKVTSNDSSVVVNKTTSGNQDVYDLSVDVTKLDAANKSLSNINNDGNKVISNIARKSVDVVAGTNIKDIVKNDVQNSDGTTTTTYTINANGAKVVAGDGVTVATGTPGSNNITDYTVSVKNTTLTAAPGSTTVTAGDNNSYAKAGDVATAITNVGKASKTTVTSNDSSVTVVSKVDSGDGHVNYDLSVDTSKVAANTNLTYKANSGTGLTTTLANGLDFKDGDNTVATVGPNGEVKYSLNPTVAGINSITTNGGNTVVNDNGVTTPSLTLTNSTPLTSSTGGKVTVPAGTGNQAVTGQTVANAINKLGDNTINLKASDGNITTKQSLNKDGGLEFNITGSNGITTTASGDTINVTIAQSGLNTSTTGGKTTVTPVTSGNTYATAGDVATAIQNAVNNSGWNAVAGSTGTGTTSGSVSNKLITPGETLKLQAGDNLNVDQSGGTFTYSLKKDISLDSVTTGDTKVANGGITIGTGSNQVSLTNNGLNNGGNKITNVAAGTNKNDAVNVGQLNAAKTELENGTNTTVSSRTGSNGQTIYKVNTDFTSIADAIGGNTKFDPTTGKIDTSAANIGGTGQTNISDAVKAAITTVSSNDASVTVNKVQKSDGHYNYDLSVDTNKIAANTNLTYKANSGTGLTTTLANGLDFKDGDNTKATVGPNGEVKYSLNPTVAGINSITTNGGNTVINDNGVTTPSLTLTNSTPLTSSTGGKVTVPAGTGNQAVTGQTVANAINKLGDNTINLKASDGNITTKQSLNKDGGLEFNITGSNGITTTASGDTINVTIAQSGLNTSTTGGKTTVTPVTSGNTYATAGDVATAIQNAVNNSGWNAVAGSTGTGTTSGSVSNKLITPGETLKLQAGDNLNVDQSGGTFTYSLKNDINVNSITAGNNKFDTSGLTISDAAGNKAITTPSGTTYTNAAGNTTVINPTGVVINKSAADPSKSVSLTDNGLDNGGNKITNVAAGVNPTDAVNVSQLKNAVNNATYNGPVVYTNAAGDKIVKANNGNYYKASDVDADGNPLPSAVAVNPSDIQHSLLNADGSTTNPSTLNNVGKGLISPASTQAINGSQLNNLGTQLGLTVDPSGTGFSNPTFAGLKNVNGSTGAAPTTFKDAVDQTIDKVNEGIIYGADNNTAGTRQQLGSRLTVESGDFASGGVNYKGQNLETSYVSDGAGNGKIIVGITENPEFNSVKAKTFTADDGAGNTTVTNGQGTTITDAAGNKNVATAAGNTYTNAAGNTTTVNSSGVTINKSAADPSKSVSLTNSGLDNGGNRITNIAAGVAPTDAVNVSQLGNAVNNLTTAINASKSEVVGGTNTNVTSSTGSNGQIVYKVDADGTTVSGGSSFVSVTQGTKDANNITDYKVDLAQGTKDKLNSIGTGNIAAGDNNTVTGSTVHNYIQNNPLTYTDDNGTTVTRNLGQNLNIMGRATGPLTTGNIGVVAAGPDTLELRLAENVDLGPNGRVTMGKTVVNDDGIKITGGPSVTSSGIDAGGKKVTNIAEGDISPTSNDAVTGRQVYNAISAGAADKATRAELAGVNNNLTAGIAGVAAMANLPQINDSASNRFNIAVAGGAYKNGRAMALGFSGVSDGGRFVYRASASLNNKRDVAVGLGVGYQFGKRDVMPNELDRMKSMVALIEEQKDSYSRQLKQQLEQESRKNQENSELIRQLMQEVQELKTKSNVSNRSNRS